MNSTLKPLKGTLTLPGDKSISHRAVMFSAIAAGESKIENLSNGGDVASTLSCLEKLGAEFSIEGTTLTTKGKGLRSLSGENIVLDCGNSGTSLRLLSGLLSGQDVHNVSLVGDDSLTRRPHNRVIDPLKSIGVDITGRDGSFIPVVINKSNPHASTIEMKIASAQVKSAVLLAGLYADGPITVIEKHTRDHTEHMLRFMGVDVSLEKDLSGNLYKWTITPPTDPLLPLNATIPGDPSSAAFFGVAATLIPGSDIVIKNILLNPTRIAWVETLKKMGANIVESGQHEVLGEIVGDLHIKSAKLNAIDLSGESIAWQIDELPVLSLAMALAQGISTVKEASELRVKESDRISVVVDHLVRAGVQASEQEDGYTIDGGELKPCEINSDGDHRIAMTFAILNYLSTGTMSEQDKEVVSTSFPSFFTAFNSLIASE